MGRQPSGTVTFLFSDIQGSTRLWEEAPDAMRRALERHDQLLYEILERHDGHTFKTVGDQFCAVFQRSIDAVEAALEIQRATRSEQWDLPRPVRLRIGIHTGEAQERNDDYYGQVVNRVARIESAAHGGQTVLSAVTYELVRDRLSEDVVVTELGSHRLKDLTRAETVYQISAPEHEHEFPTLNTLDTHHHNLPIQSTPFIGREKEVARLASLITDGDHRIVTILGPGGMGKTRTALQVAAETIEHFDDGVYFVDLSSVRDEAGITVAVAAALGIEVESPAAARQAVDERLASSTTLLILDNFEQIANGARTIVPWVHGDGTTILTTSRTALQLREEHLYSLPPLAMPSEGETPDLDQLSQYESVKLFLDRAISVSDTFALTTANAAAVAEICHRLDGIPLAIELAAARTRLLNPDAIMRRLSARLRLLTGGSRDLPPRQQTLRSTIDWSYELLDPVDRSVFAALAVFDGLIRLPAASAVLAVLGLDEFEAIEALERLERQSLVLVVPIAEEEPAFAMLETIQEYASERLAEHPDRVGVHEAHSRYFEALVADAESLVRSRSQASFLKATWNEIENVIAAERWLEQSDPERFAHLVLNSSTVKRLKGMPTDALWRLDQAAVATTNPELKIRINVARADSALCVHDYGLAKSAVAQAAQLASQGAEQALIAEIRYREAHCAAVTNDAETTRLYEQLLESARETGNRYLIGKALVGLEVERWAVDDIAGAMELNAEARALFEEIGDMRSVGLCDSNAGVAAYIDKDYEESRRRFESSVRLLNSVGANADSVESLSNLTALYLGSQEWGLAMSSAQSLEQAARTAAKRAYEIVAAAAMGEARLGTDDSHDALRHARRAQRMIQGEPRTIEEGYAYRVLGDAQAACRATEEAREAYRLAIKALRTADDREELGKAEAGLRSLGNG